MDAVSLQGVWPLFPLADEEAADAALAHGGAVVNRVSRHLDGSRRDLSRDYVEPRKGWGPFEDAPGSDTGTAVEEPPEVAAPAPTEAAPFDFDAAAAAHVERTAPPAFPALAAVSTPPGISADVAAAAEAREADDWAALQAILALI